MKPMAFDGWFFKGGSTQNRWILVGDFSKGGVHKTNEFWWVIFQRGEYTKPMNFGGWFFKAGSTQNRWLFDGFWNVFYGFQKLSARGVYFGKCGILFPSRPSTGSRNANLIDTEKQQITINHPEDESEISFGQMDFRGFVENWQISENFLLAKKSVFKFLQLQRT